jgi:fructose-1,6-bisphosphatase/inositol monophosphatase family enzyme
MADVDSETIAFANRLADTAGAVIRPYFRQRIDVADKRPMVDGKPVFDPVTLADKNAETAIRTIIDRERPEDGILGEEHGEKPGKNGLRWVLDPVDGTRAFITGRHEWGSLIALEKNGRPILGIIDQPILGERFVGANGRAELRAGDEVTPLATRRGTLALGFVDVIVETTFHRWDVAALIPVVEGAGGIITNWQGGDCSAGGQVLAAGDARLHADAMALLAG